MEIEKIKNYNQKMLAIFSTIIVIIAAIGLISLIVFLIADIIPDGRPDTNALLSGSKVDELRKDSLRNQIISYNTPELVDTASLVYVIPINVKTLDGPENIDQQVLGLININKEVGSGSSEYRTANYYYGAFNNLVVYDFLNNKTKIVCPGRIIGTDLEYNYFKDEILLTFCASGYDIDNDDQITLNDFRDLYIFSLESKELKKITQPNSTVESYKFIPGKKGILITFGFDRNKDNKFDIETEPTFNVNYDYATGNLLNIVGKDLEISLQNIIDNKP